MIDFNAILRIFFLLITSILLNGCSTLSYYAQSVSGQTEILLKQQSIDMLLEQKTTDEKLRERLQLVKDIRQFSIERLGLPDNASYSKYADLERRYVVWNIFATEEFSLKALQSCFLFVGCLDYRGYFNKHDAQQEKHRLEQLGYDVFLGGVAAYSTLGWFNDPVLNTMLHWSETDLAKVIFHELAHQKLYVKNDSAFNESFADTVALIGVRLWLEEKGDAMAVSEFLSERDREKQFIGLVIQYKSKLESLYASGQTNENMRQEKQKLFSAMKHEYEHLKSSWRRGSYDNWFNHDLNNAKLASVLTYRKYVDNMLKIYEKMTNKLSLFYDIIGHISQCSSNKREALLLQGVITVEC